jgi:hypothetical protein
MLEAAMLRCAQDRDGTRYDTECVNARQAVQQIVAKEEEERKAEFAVRSESKRQALRRAQEAAAEARRRAAVSQSLRKEAEYLAQFGVAAPPDTPSPEIETAAGNTPLAVIPGAKEPIHSSTGNGDFSPATDGGNAPGISAQPEQGAAASDLESIRDELQRRNEGDGD